MEENGHLYHGKIFVLSAPSGAGKTTLVKNIKERFPFLAESISCTTRAPRKNEVDGVDYFFLTVEEFINWKNRNLFAETAEVHGNFYGTPLNFLKERIAEGKNIICDIDYQGAINIKKAFPDESVLIFILPPSMEELEKRLRKRATDNEETVKTRLKNAQKEISSYVFYNHVIINDKLDVATEQLKHIIRAYTESSVLHNLETIKRLTGKNG